MENKINVANILKDCPKGMELNCTMYNNAYFDSVNENVDYPIRIKIGKTDVINLTKEGYWNKFSNAKCVIFPKGKNTWEGFQRPFKDGDILATNDGKFIAIIKKNGGKYYVCCHYTNGAYFETDSSGWFDRLATEEEKQKLFDAIKANGYKWNAETKTLTQLKHDIITFKLFDQVLGRDTNDCVWRIDFYSNYENERRYPYGCIGSDYKQCIPYNEETAYLANTTNACPDKYKTWKDEE